MPGQRAVFRPLRLRDLKAERDRSLAELRGTRVFAVSGIGNPGSFHRTVQEAGAVLVGSLAYPDHHAFTEEDRRRMGVSARLCEAVWIVTTDKDAVRRSAPRGSSVVIWRSRNRRAPGPGALGVP
jgi:tetraacyldisaccharide 4'-kinase